MLVVIMNLTQKKVIHFHGYTYFVSKKFIHMFIKIAFQQYFKNSHFHDVSYALHHFSEALGRFVPPTVDLTKMP